MHLGDDRDAVLLEPFDVPQLPQRAGAVERTAGDLGGERRELARSTGRRQRGAAHVVVEVEVGILDPQRVVQVERHGHEAAPERREQVHPLPQQVAHPVDVERRGRRRRVEDRRAQHVHVGRGRLDGEEGGIEAGKSLHGRSLPSPAGRMKAWTLPPGFSSSRSSGSASRSTRSGPCAGRSFLVGFSFFSAWLTTELALFHLVVADRRHRRVRRPTARSDRGPVASGSRSPSCRGSDWSRMVAVALRTGAVMDAALRDALAGGYDDEPAAPISWARVLWPNPRRRGVQRIRNLAYVDDGRPPSSPRHLPAPTPGVGDSRSPARRCCSRSTAARG